MDSTSNTFSIFIKELKIGNDLYKFFDISKINEEKYSLLPFSIRVILESAVRNCDEIQITSKDVKNILNWPETHKNNIEIPFLPSRVILQDFTGIPAIVDLATLRDTVAKFGGDPSHVLPFCPVDLALDNSLQVDISRKLIVSNPNNTTNQAANDTSSNSTSNENNQILIESVYKECPFHFIRTECAEMLERNQSLEFERSYERFQLLKWSSNISEDITVVPPGKGIAHQINLEYLSRIVFNKNNFLYPDSLVGTDSHTTMVNGLGIIGWGVGGVEAESVMFGQAINIVLPQVIGFKIVGNLNELCTSTDVVLTIIKNLRKLGVENKFVEFYGPGVTQLSISDRETIANMCPEYGAIVGYFAADEMLIQHLINTGRKKETVEYIREYLKAVKLIRDYNNESANNDDSDRKMFTQIYELDLSTVLPCVSGPKRPMDKTVVSDLKESFKECLTNKNGFNGYGLKNNSKEIKIIYNNEEISLKHGSVILAAINSCTNNSNPSAMLAAGILAKKATDFGLKIKPYIKTSMSPGSGVVTEYLKKSGLLPSLELLGFNINGYGCNKCINNITSIDESISVNIQKNDLITIGILSGNRNFEGRIHPTTKGSYLASPPLCIAFAIAGRIDIDFEKEPLGFCEQAKKYIFLKDIWPTRNELQNLESNYILPEIFLKSYEKNTEINEWSQLNAPKTVLFPWSSKSTYIKIPPFLDQMSKEFEPSVQSIKNAHVLLFLGDSITTDHISPAGSISRNCPAAKYLIEKGLTPREFNSYGSRRGNDAVMSRGTFANIRLFNKISDQVAGKTVHFPTGRQLDVWDAAEMYKNDNIPVIIIAGKDYGSGSSRDWAAKGQWMLGVKAVIAESFDRIHRSNLIGMGILPLQFLNDENSKFYQLTGREKFTIDLNELNIRQIVEVAINNGKKFKVQARIDSNMEMNYVLNGGLLPYVARKFL